MLTLLSTFMEASSLHKLGFREAIEKGLVIVKGRGDIK